MRNRTSDSGPKGGETAPIHVQIERIVPGGAGLGFVDGRAILVPGSAPGDLLEVDPGKRGPQAELVRILEPGPDRVEPVCPHASRCGGCDLMHLGYSAQIDAKRSIVLDALKRTGQTDVSDLLKIVANPEPLHSRIRATWHPGPDGIATYIARGSRTPVAIDTCLILDPVLEIARRNMTITETVTGLTNRRVASSSAHSPATEITFQVAGTSLVTSADAFFQANGALLESFVDHVISRAEPAPKKRVWDLYAGIGLFSAPMAARGARVTSVESDPTATAFARRNAQSITQGSMELVNVTVEAFLTGKRSVPDVVVVDPPRTGLSQPASARLIALRPERIVSVSCDPATFARDHHILVTAGYTLNSLVAFDLYPQTHHVELVGRYDL